MDASAVVTRRAETAPGGFGEPPEAASRTRPRRGTPSQHHAVMPLRWRATTTADTRNRHEPTAPGRRSPDGGRIGGGY